MTAIMDLDRGKAGRGRKRYRMMSDAMTSPSEPSYSPKMRRSQTAVGAMAPKESRKLTSSASKVSYVLFSYLPGC